VWDATVFTKNATVCWSEVAKEFLVQVVEQAQRAGMGLGRAFTVDGTLLEALGQREEFSTKEQERVHPHRMILEIPRWIIAVRSARTNTRVEKRSRALLARKGPGKEAKLSYSGNLLVENRNGLIVDSRVGKPRAQRAQCRAGNAAGNSEAGA